MKHLLNNLTEEEKNSIREQHTGGMKVVTENFSKLINTKSGNVKSFIKEQEDNVLKDLLSKGFKDITSWYFSPEGVVYIPDGDYKGVGNGYYEYLQTKEGKDTGYVLFFDAGVRGVRNSNVKVQQNGGAIGSNGGGKIIKILLNDTTLNSSGLSTKK
jgi:hypothetical protein